MANPPLTGQSTDGDIPGIRGENFGAGIGVLGTAYRVSGLTRFPAGTGVFGSGNIGVRAESFFGPGLSASSELDDAVKGQGKGGAGVSGESESGFGVSGPVKQGLEYKARSESLLLDSLVAKTRSLVVGLACTARALRMESL